MTSDLPRSNRWKPYLIVELRHDSRITLEDERFVGPKEKADECAKLNQCLERARARKVAGHFPLGPKAFRRRAFEAPASLNQAVDSEFAMAGFVEIHPGDPSECERLVERFRALDSVWMAYVQGASRSAGVNTLSISLERVQGYLDSAPAGLGLKDAWLNFQDSKGSGITVCDIEGDWNTDHEILPAGIQSWGGVRSRYQPDVDHGTAVLGLLAGQPGNWGVLGICHEATVTIHSDYFGSLYAPGRAIYTALSRLSAGDVILMETQTENLEPTQTEQAALCAVRAAVGAGLIVVAAAGNGGLDLDDARYKGTGAQRGVGALVVGAGVPAFNYDGNFGRTGYGYLGQPRSRLGFSNYGTLVNLQGWGANVASSGYGDAQGGVEDHWYTLTFGGTSSASALVAGVAACVQSHVKSVSNKTLSCQQMRDLLVSTGWPQEAEEGESSPQRKIGPQPSLWGALGQWVGQKAGAVSKTGNQPASKPGRPSRSGSKGTTRTSRTRVRSS